MKKLFLLSCILCISAIAFTQNKFKTVKRSDVIVPQETLDKPVDISGFQNSITHPKYLTKPTDNQTYINLISKKDGLKVTLDENGMPSMIEGIPTNISNIKKGSTRNARMSAEMASAYNYLEAVKPYLRLTNPDAELNILKSEIDEIETTHLRIQQTYKGVNVYGAEMILHKKDNEEVSLLNGHFYPTPQIENVKPSLSEDNIGKLAISDVRKSSIVKPMTATEMTMLKYEKPKTELIIYHQNEKADGERLAYHVTVRPNFLERWIYVMDANSGEILDKYNHTCTLDGVAKATAMDLNGVSKGINTYQSGSSYILIDATKSMFKGGAVKADDPQGVIWTIDATNSKVNEDLAIKQISSTNNSWNNATGVSAHFNAGVAYDYYKNTHGRTSLNGKGGTIVSIINITDENGKGFDNAFWNGEYMGYGNGGTYFKPLAGGLDVAGHEMTHGVIENTANLEYKSQSGAINESLADCFGAMVERKNGADGWRLGEDVMKGNFYPTGCLRDLANPNNGGRSLNDNGYQPGTMNQYYSGSEDNYGVHINSGVPNNAFYRFATASGMTKEKAEKIYYRALTIYLTRTSKFLDLRRAVIQSATDLKASAGVTDADINNAKLAFDAVGITDPNAPNPSTNPPATTPVPPAPKADVPVNTGTEGLLSYDPVRKILYKSSIKGEADPSSFVELATNIVIENKPTVPDDASFAYFVAGDGFIKRVNLSATPKVENVSSTGVWRNVAVSKDGKKLAALRKLATTSAVTDKQITVFNLSAGTSRVYTLYNPTYTKGVSTGQVQNADAIEWDHQSENVVYDAYNLIKSATGTESNFWDVGFINVWNGSKNDYGTGQIDKLFTSLDAGENIGNPSFSKNSTNVIAFDYFIEKDDLNYVIGVNTERTDGLDFIYKNNTLGYPEYSRKDDFVLYNYYTTDSKTNKDVLNTYQISMDASKIKSVPKTEKFLVGQSAYAVWYTAGTRALPTKQNQTISLAKIQDKLVGDAAFDVTVSASSNLAIGLSIVYGPANISNKRITLTGTAGRVKVNAFQDGNGSFYNVAKADSFCVNPLKPTISVIKKTDSNGDYWEYTSSSATGNVWYREGVILEDLRGSQSIKVGTGLKFTVQIVTSDGCASAFSDVRQDPAITKPLASELTLEASITVSPNPTSDEIRVIVPQNLRIESIKLNDMSGSKVSEKQGDKSNIMTLNIHNLNQGNYILQIMTNEGMVTKKVTKE